MINLKVNGRKVKVPTSYEEMPFAMFEKITQIKEDDPDANFQVIACVLGLTESEKQKKLDAYSAALVVRALKFLKEELADEPLPVGSLEDISIAAYKDMQNMVATAETATEKAKWVVAIYKQFQSGDYNFGKAKERLAEVEKMPAAEVIRTANFFLRNLHGLRNGTLPTASLRNTATKRFWRALTNWTNSISLMHSLFSAKILTWIEKRFFGNTR